MFAQLSGCVVMVILLVVLRPELGPLPMAARHRQRAEESGCVALHLIDLALAFAMVSSSVCARGSPCLLMKLTPPTTMVHGPVRVVHTLVVHVQGMAPIFADVYRCVAPTPERCYIL